ncbi:MAG: OmpA family protein [Deltaproteobacteria bacterium]|nr:OmpA family protein [Deltaproteobacteria bacterium]
MNSRIGSRQSTLGMVLSAALLVAPGLATAQQTDPEVFGYDGIGRVTAMDVNQFEPSASGRALLTLDRASVPSHLTFTAGLWANYAYRPLVLGGGTTTTDIVRHDFRGEVHASLALFQFLEFSAAMPLAVTHHVEGALAPLCGAAGPYLALMVDCNRGELAAEQQRATSFRSGDARVSVKVPILRGPWEFAARMQFAVPFGSIGVAQSPSAAGQAFSSANSMTVMPQLLLSRQFQRVLFVANLGYRFRERTGIAAGSNPLVIDDEIQWGAGARFAITERVGISGDLHGRMGTFFGSAPLLTSWPVELALGAQAQLSPTISLDLGARSGVPGGYGVPTIGVFGGLRVSLAGRTCLNGPEDYDGFEDNDYCGDPDNDADGVPDALDRCPNDPEDRDGVLDEDGCPDPDNDADGILDDDDRCPTEAEDRDGNADTDGCPDPDNDGDGIPDTRDECINDPEDLDNYQDEDGCPEPGPAPVVVTRTESRLLLSQRIYFEYDSDVIRNVSFDILNEVGSTIRRSPDIGLLRIEGHTDSAGVAQYNLDLSYRRARAVVEYLVQRGVERPRLEFRGFGSQRLAVADDSPDAQALNRRVEFVIVNQTSAPPVSAGNPPAQTDPAGTQRPRRRRRRAR